MGFSVSAPYFLPAAVSQAHPKAHLSPKREVDPSLTSSHFTPSSSWSLFLLVPLPPSLEYRAQQGLLTSWPSLKSSNRLAYFLHVLRESLLTAQGAASWGNWKVPDISQSTVVTGLSGNASGIRPACIITCTERPLDLRSQAGWRPGWLLGCGI